VPRIALNEFGDGEAEGVYIAGRMAEARLIEELFNGRDVEYAVEVEAYLGGTVFGIAEYAGAAFYVSVEQAEFCRGILRDAGFKAGLIDREISGYMIDVSYRRALPGDYAAILSLQSANYVANLSAEERKQGFLSAQFTLEQTAQIAEDLGTIVAVIDNQIGGFVCAFRNEFETGSSVIAKMLESYDRFNFEARPLSAFKSYIYGPVCIGREYRGRGLLRGLYEAQKKDLAGQFEIGVAFVSRSNPHSLQAHIKGLGMTEVGDFECRGSAYVTLAFRV
jgi:hypothetical protein